MKIQLSFALLLIVGFFSATAQTEVTIYTNQGDFVVQMEDSLAPITSGNFINLATNKHFDGVLFYRVVNNFVIQGGTWPVTFPTIPDEFDSTGTLSNVKMTISMANSGPNTGSSEFFINLKNNIFLDYDKSPFTSAHPVFGEVTSGWSIVEAIEMVPVDGNDKPISDVVMDSIRVTGSVLSQEEIQNNAKISTIYPNPINEQSILDFYSVTAGASGYEIVNSAGQLISKGNLDFAQGKNKIPFAEFNMQTQPKGTYFMNITYGNKSVALKFQL